jgi:hypothetical protein
MSTKTHLTTIKPIEGKVQCCGNDFVKRGSQIIPRLDGALEASLEPVRVTPANPFQITIQCAFEAEFFDRIGMRLAAQVAHAGKRFFHVGGGAPKLGHGGVIVAVGGVDPRHFELESGGGQELPDLVVERRGDAGTLGGSELA